MRSDAVNWAFIISTKLIQNGGQNFDKMPKRKYKLIGDWLNY